MSNFPQPSWMNSLQGLIASGDQDQPEIGDNSGFASYQTAHGRPALSRLGASYFSPGGHIQGSQWFKQPDFRPYGAGRSRSGVSTDSRAQAGGGRREGQRAPTYGEILSAGALADFQRGEQARQQELAAYMGLIGNLAGSMRGAGQMVQDVRGAGERNMRMMQDQAERIRQAAEQGEQYYDRSTGQMLGAYGDTQRRMDQSLADARRQMMGSLGESRSQMLGSFDLSRQQMESALGESKQQMGQALTESRGRFDEGIGTLKQSKSDYDFGRRDDTAANVMGIQQQYKNQIDSIARRDDLTDEQKAMAQDELRQSMRQQSSAMAAQADAQARQTMLSLDQSISQMQAMAAQSLGQLGATIGQATGQMGIGVGQALGQMGIGIGERLGQMGIGVGESLGQMGMGAAQTLGQMGIGIGQTMGQLGLQTSAQRMQAEENITNFYNNLNQYNTSMLQGTQAAALNYTLSGNQAMASIINAAPFGPTSIFGTIAHMIQAVDEDRSNRMGSRMGQMFGRLA